MSIIGDASIAITADTTGFGKTLKIGIFAAAAAIVGFGIASVKAFSDAQQAQAKFDFAFSKFPKLADVSRASLEKLATSESHFTKFSRLAFLSAESQLAAFNLTGKQVSELIPIVADYAARTGKDLPEAATLVGRALLGNTRALKEVGINLTITKQKTVDLAKEQKAVADAQQNLTFLEERQSAKKKLTISDQQQLIKAEERLKTAQDKLNAATATAGKVTSAYDKVFGALRDKVGGFAAKQGKTLAGQLDILRNRFDDIKVKVGAALAVGLEPLVGFINDKVVPAIERFVDKLTGPKGLLTAVGPESVAIVQAFFQGFNSQAAKDAGQTLQTTNAEAITLQDILPALVDAFRSLGANIKLTVDILSSWVRVIVGAGVQAEHVVRDVIGGFQAVGRAFTGAAVQAEHAVRDIFGAWNAVVGFFRDLPGHVINAIGDINHEMFIIGKNILTSLLNGAISIFNSGDWGNFWNGVGAWIVDHKGPPEKDRLLLFKSGQLIMDGLRAGMASQFGELTRTLAQATRTIQAPALSLAGPTSSQFAREAAQARPFAPPLIINMAATDPRVLANEIAYAQGRQALR